MISLYLILDFSFPVDPVWIIQEYCGNSIYEGEVLIAKSFLLLILEEN